MKKFFFALLILAFLAAGSLYFAKQRIFAPSETENWTTFQVENGSSAVKIGKILEAKDRTKAGVTAPACGLFFKSVKYN